MPAPTLVVMAAGIGSRYGGLKQIDPVGPGGEIIIDYSVHDALAAGFGDVVFIIRRDIHNEFREHVGRRIEARVETRYAFQELSAVPAGFSVPPERKKPWGTGHAVLAARETVDGNFAVINADDFYGAESFRLLGEYLKTAKDSGGAGDYCMAGYVLRNTLSDHGHVARGISTVDDAGNLLDVKERTRVEKFGDRVRYFTEPGIWEEVDPESTVSMNMWGFTPRFFDELAARFPAFLEARGTEPKSEFFIPEVVGALIAEDRARVRVLPTAERWFGVTYREDMPQVRAAVQALVERGAYPQRLWS